MSATASPFGLRPSYHFAGGVIRPDQATIASAYAANIFMGSPVGYVAAGTLELAAAGGTGATGACGAFQGVEYTPTATGRRTVGNMWPASTAASDIVAYMTSDPWIVYAIQANATLTIAAIGAEYNWSTNNTSSGNTTTGLSTVSLDVASADSPAGLKVVGLTVSPDNNWGDAFPIVNVLISEHQFNAVIPAW